MPPSPLARRWTVGSLLVLLAMAAVLACGAWLRASNLHRTGLSLTEWQWVEAMSSGSAEGGGGAALLDLEPGALERAARLPALLLGIAAVVLVFLYGVRAAGGSRGIALAAAAAWSLGPLGVGLGVRLEPAAGLTLVAAWVLHGVLWLGQRPGAVWRQLNLALAFSAATVAHPLGALLALGTLPGFCHRHQEALHAHAGRLWPWGAALACGALCIIGVAADAGAPLGWASLLGDPAAAGGGVGGGASGGASGGVSGGVSGGPVAGFGDWLGHLYCGTQGLAGPAPGKGPSGGARLVFAVSAAGLTLAGLVAHAVRRWADHGPVTVPAVAAALLGAWLVSRLAPALAPGARGWAGLPAAALCFPVVAVGWGELVAEAVRRARRLVARQRRRHRALAGNRGGIVLAWLAGLALVAALGAVAWPAARAAGAAAMRLAPWADRLPAGPRYRELATWVERERRPDSAVLVHAGAHTAAVTRLLAHYGVRDPTAVRRARDLRARWSPRALLTRLGRRRTHVVLVLARLPGSRTLRLLEAARRRFPHLVGYAVHEDAADPRRADHRLLAVILELGCRAPKPRLSGSIRASSSR